MKRILVILIIFFISCSEKEVEISDVSRDAEENHLSKGREDKVVKSPVSPEQFSPYLEKGFFKVPKVIDPDH